MPKASVATITKNVMPRIARLWSEPDGLQGLWAFIRTYYRHAKLAMMDNQETPK